MNRRTHSFVINVTFDKPCSKSFALRAVKDDGGIDVRGGEHYTTVWNDGEPETFKVRSVRHPPRSRS